jgi:glycosyltransferase involved in cell wall biosynthesis
MRVAFLSVSGEMGGSEVSLLELIRGIRRHEPSWTLTAIVPKDGPLARRIADTASTVRILPLPAALARLGESPARGRTGLARKGTTMLAAARSVPGYIKGLSRLLAEIDADVVHSNGFKLHIAGARAAAARSSLVWHIHEYISTRPLSRTLLKRHVSSTAAVVANSKSVAADLTAALGSAVSVTTIYNAVDLDEFSPHGERIDLDRLSGFAPAPADTIRVGLVATFGRWKGHETFLRALQRLDSSRCVRGYIVGAPLYDTAGSQHTVEELRSLADTLGVSDRVGFTGFIERPAAALRALDVVVHASTEPEPFGLVIAEGMACGRAVIVSAAGGAAELVQDDVNALTHRPGDVDGLARAIARAVSDAGLRRRLGEEARCSAVALFDPDRFARSFVDLYRRVHAPMAVRA